MTSALTLKMLHEARRLIMTQPPSYAWQQFIAKQAALDFLKTCAVEDPLNLDTFCRELKNKVYSVTISYGAGGSVWCHFWGIVAESRQLMWHRKKQTNSDPRGIETEVKDHLNKILTEVEKDERAFRSI